MKILPCKTYIGSIARKNPKLKNEKFLDKQRAIEVGFELAKQIARDTVLKFYQSKKSSVEVEIRALRPMLMKDLKKLKHNKINKRFSGDNVADSEFQKTIVFHSGFLGNSENFQNFAKSSNTF